MSNVVEFIYKLQDKVSGTLKQMEQNSQRVHDQLERTKKKVDSLDNSLGRMAKRYLSFAAVVMGGREFFRLGMDMEATKAKFEVLLGSVERGNKVFKEVNEMAKLTPFNTSDVVGASEQLLAFNYDVDKLMPTLHMLGDVAMGDAQKLQGLTRAFAKVSSTGKLSGRELMQMTDQGFNPLVLISEKTGKSMEQLNEEMARGQITFAMVEDAFRTATSEGGRFHGMMEKMAETGRGKLNTLMGALQIKLAELAEKAVPYLNKILEFGLRLVDNFDRIAKTVWAALLPVRAFFNGIVTLFQYFKNNGAMLALTVPLLVAVKVGMLQASLAARGLSISAVLSAKAFNVLNAVLLKNPFTAVIAGITMLVGALVMMRKRTQEATNDLETINKRANEYAADERARLDRIFDALRKTNPESETRNKLVKQLKEMYPDLIGKMNLEKASLNGLEVAYNNIAAAIQRKAEAQAYESMIQDLYTQKANIEAANNWAALQSLLTMQSASGYNAEQTRRLFKGSKLKIGGQNYNVDHLFKDYDAVKDLEKRISKLTQKAATGQTGGMVAGGAGFDPDAASSVSGLTGGGSRPTNITINLRNLIEYLNMYPQTVREGVSDMENQLIEGLLRVVNSANRIAVR